MLRAFGHNKSSIINGGLPRWVDEGFPLETGQPQTSPAVSYPEPKLNQKVIRGQYFSVGRDHTIISAHSLLYRVRTNGFQFVA